MSTIATGQTARADGVRPQSVESKKARPKESRKRRVRTAEHWPAWTDEVRWGVLNPSEWPRWTSEVRVTLSRKGR